MDIPIPNDIEDDMLIDAINESIFDNEGVFFDEWWADRFREKIMLCIFLIWLWSNVMYSKKAFMIWTQYAYLLFDGYI